MGADGVVLVAGGNAWFLVPAPDREGTPSDLLTCPIGADGTLFSGEFESTPVDWSRISRSERARCLELYRQVVDCSVLIGKL